MDFVPNLTLDELVREEVKGKRITIWDKIFKKYDNVGEENTNVINVEDIEEVFLKKAKADLNKSVRREIVKRKRSRPQKVNRRSKRTKVLKSDDSRKCSVSDAGVNLRNCVSEEPVSEVTPINSIEEFQNHQELVNNLNHEFFNDNLESDVSDEVLIEDDPLECDLIGAPNLVNVQNGFINHVKSPVKQIQTDEINMPPEALKKSCEKTILKDVSDNIQNSSNLVYLDHQNCSRQELVSEWLNKTEPFKKCTPSKYGDDFVAPAVIPPIVPRLNDDVDSKIKPNHCGECKRHNLKMENSTTEELLSKRISTRFKRPNFCKSCSNHKSLDEADICHDVEKSKKKSHPADAPCNNKSLENYLEEELHCKGTSAKCKQATVCISSHDVEICCRKHESNQKKIVSQLPNIKTLKEEVPINSEIKSDDSKVTDKINHKKLTNFEMDDLFYKRNKRFKVCPSSRELGIDLAKQSNTEKPTINRIKQLKSYDGPAKSLKDDHCKNLMHESNHRTSKTSNLNSYGQSDESSSSCMNSIMCSSRTSNTSTPLKDMEKLPSNRNASEENYLKIKNKIENEFKSTLGYMAYNRHKLHQSNGASSKEETQFWENAVRQEIKRLSGVIPTTVLLRYMKEYINLRITSLRKIGDASRHHKKCPHH